MGVTTAIRTRRFAVRVSLPDVGRRRLICASSLASTASALWIASPLWLGQVPLLPDADLSPALVASGLLGPPLVAAWTLVMMERRILRDLQSADRREWGQEARR